MNNTIKSHVSKKASEAFEKQKKTNELNEKLLLQIATDFKGNALFIHDCIKQIMQQHNLDTRDKNLQNAFMRIAIGVETLDYPKTQ